MLGKYLFGMLLIYGAAILCSTIVDQSWFDSANILTLGSGWFNFSTYTDKLNILTQLFMWDLPLFKNVDGTANDFWILRMVLTFISVAFWFNFLMYIIQSIAGIASKLFGGAK